MNFKESGKESSLYKNNSKSVTKDIEAYNEKYGDDGLLDLATRAGVKLSTKTLSKAAAKIGAKQIAKRIVLANFRLRQ